MAATFNTDRYLNASQGGSFAAGALKVWRSPNRRHRCGGQIVPVKVQPIPRRLDAAAQISATAESELKRLEEAPWIERPLANRIQRRQFQLKIGTANSRIHALIRPNFEYIARFVTNL